MKLAEWMTKNNFKLEKFSELTGVSISYLWKLRRFEVIPSLLLAKIIVIATGGEVSYDDLLGEDSARKKKLQSIKVKKGLKRKYPEKKDPVPKEPKKVNMGLEEVIKRLEQDKISKEFKEFIE